MVSVASVPRRLADAKKAMQVVSRLGDVDVSAIGRGSRVCTVSGSFEYAIDGMELAEDALSVVAFLASNKCFDARRAMKLPAALSSSGAVDKLVDGGFITFSECREAYGTDTFLRSLHAVRHYKEHHSVFKCRDVPAIEWTGFEIVARLKHKGWSWAPLPPARQRLGARYMMDGQCCNWYCSPHQAQLPASRAYLLCLYFSAELE